MPVLEVAKALLSLAEIYAKLTEGRDGDEAERAASASLVGPDQLARRRGSPTRRRHSR